MSSKFGYQLTQKAEADLDDIVSYIAVELSNPKAASDFLDRFDRVIEETRTFPESGSPVINEFLPVTNIRKNYVGNYIVFYLPDFSAKTIYVLRILYGKRNINEILRSMDASDTLPWNSPNEDKEK